MTTTYLRPTVGDEVRILRPHNLAGLTGPITDKLYAHAGAVWFRIDLDHSRTVCLQADDIEVAGRRRLLEAEE